MASQDVKAPQAATELQFCLSPWSRRWSQQCIHRWIVGSDRIWSLTCILSFLFLQVAKWPLPGLALRAQILLKDNVTVPLLLRYGVNVGMPSTKPFIRIKDPGILVGKEIVTQGSPTLSGRQGEIWDPAVAHWVQQNHSRHAQRACCATSIPLLFSHVSGHQSVNSEGLGKAVLCYREIAFSSSCRCQRTCLKAKEEIMGKERTSESHGSLQGLLSPEDVLLTALSH